MNLIKKTSTPFPLERIPDIEAHPENFRLEIEIPYVHFGDQDQEFPIILNQGSGEADALRSCVILSEFYQKIPQPRFTELGLVKFTYDRFLGKPVRIDAVYSGREGVSESDDEKYGVSAARRFDSEDIVRILQPEYDTNGVRPFVISLDPWEERDFFDQRFPELTDLIWCGAGKDLNWQSFDESFPESFSNLKLLAMKKRMFYKENRPLDRSLALMWFFKLFPEAFNTILAHADDRGGSIFVHNSYSVRDTLKDRGYRYHGEKKAWYRHFQTEDEVMQENDALRDLLIDPEGRNLEIVMTEARDRYKKQK